MIANVHMLWLCQITTAIDPDSTTNSLNDSFKAHASSLNTSFEILHWKMHIGVIDLIAQKDLSKIKPEVKLLGCLKVLSLGVSFSTFCDYFQMGESSVGEAVSRFTCEVIKNKDKI